MALVAGKCQRLPELLKLPQEGTATGYLYKSCRDK